MDKIPCQTEENGRDRLIQKMRNLEVSRNENLTTMMERDSWRMWEGGMDR